MRKTNANIVKVLKEQQDSAKYLRDMYEAEGKKDLAQQYNGLYLGYESAILLLISPADHLTSIAQIYGVDE